MVLKIIRDRNYTYIDFIGEIETLHYNDAVGVSEDSEYKFADKLEEIVLKKNLYFVNASTPFKGQEIDDYIIYPIDSHPNGKAHKIFADVLYQYLFQDENGPLLKPGSE